MPEETPQGTPVEVPATAISVMDRSEVPLIVNIAASAEIMQAQLDALEKFVKANLKDGKHYGIIPGTGTKDRAPKKVLFKAGAERVCLLYGFYPEFRPLRQTVDFAAPFFDLQYECVLVSKRSGARMGSGIGSCNSHETKYRWRESRRVCTSCGQETIIKGKAEYGGGWICFTKKGGCGAKFREGDEAIESQKIGRSENEDAADLLNTIDKMAQKRALLAAVLVATGLSEEFTQDLEDQAQDPSVPGQASPPVTPKAGGGTPTPPAAKTPPGEAPTLSGGSLDAEKAASDAFWACVRRLGAVKSAADLKAAAPTEEEKKLLNKKQLENLREAYRAKVEEFGNPTEAA